MTKAIYIILAFVFFIILQTTVFSRLALFGAKPDLVLILVIFLALKKGSFLGETYGFIGGLLEDSVAFGLLGIQAMVKTLVGFGVGLLKNKFEEDNIILLMVLVFLITLFSGLGGSLLRVFFGFHNILSQNILQILMTAIYSTALSPLVFQILKKIYADEK